MFKRLIALSAPCLSLLMLAGVCSAENAPHEFESWKACQIGTTVKMEERDTAYPDVVRTTTVKLIEINDKEGKVEAIRDGGTHPNDNKPEFHRIMPDESVATSTTKPTATVAHTGPTTKPNGVIGEGDEDMVVAGRKVHAHWVRKSFYAGSTETVWTSVEIPGGFAMIQEVENTDNNHRERTCKIVEINVPQ